jgi:hypothetical protein
MLPPVACMMCVVTPDNAALIVPVAQATVIAMPFFFRTRIVAGVRRAIGRPVPDDEPEMDADDRCDTPPGDDPVRRVRSEPPGALRP